MFNKHFFKFLVTFAVIILIGLAGLYLIDRLGATGAENRASTAGDCAEGEVC